MLFLKMLIFSKNKSVVQENEESFEMFENIIFSNWNIQKYLIN